MTWLLHAHLLEGTARQDGLVGALDAPLGVLQTVANKVDGFAAVEDLVHHPRGEEGGNHALSDMVHVHPFVPLSLICISLLLLTLTSILVAHHRDLHEELRVHVQQTPVHCPLPGLLQHVRVDVLQQRQRQTAVHRVAVVRLQVRATHSSHEVEHRRSQRAATQPDARHEDVVQIRQSLQRLLAEEEATR